jgi:hypothetical protein
MGLRAPWRVAIIHKRKGEMVWLVSGTIRPTMILMSLTTLTTMTAYRPSAVVVRPRSRPRCVLNADISHHFPVRRLNSPKRRQPIAHGAVVIVGGTICRSIEWLNDEDAGIPAARDGR